MTRFDDWDVRLANAIDGWQTAPFRWGHHDCAMFAARCVAAITGVDPAAAYRETYADEAGAERVLTEVGGLDAALRARFGEPVPILCARRGDLLYRVDGNGGEMVAVCFGRVGLVPGDSHTLHNPRFEGRQVVGGEVGLTPWLVQYPLRAFTHAYRVG